MDEQRLQRRSGANPNLEHIAQVRRDVHGLHLQDIATNWFWAIRPQSRCSLAGNVPVRPPLPYNQMLPPRDERICLE